MMEITQKNNLCDESKTGRHVDIQPSLNFNFKCKDSPADIIAVNSREAWIAPLESKTVQQYTSTGEQLSNVEVGFKVQCFAVYDQRNFILSNYAGKGIYRLSKDGEITKLVNTSPLSPNGISVLKDDRGFLVCLVGTTGGKLVRYTKNGNSRLQSIKNDTSGHPLYKFPRRVVENGNGDIVAIDIGCMSVITIDRNGLYRWTYQGTSENKRKGQVFDPWDICCNSEQQLLISDTKNNSIELLDKDGRFLRNILTKEHGINRPLGISLDDDGKLWVGHSFGNVHVFSFLHH